MSLTGSSCESSRQYLKFAAGAQALIASLVLSMSSALAGDWSFNGRVSDKVEIFDNFGLLPKSGGYVMRDSLGASGDFAYTTHISKFDILADIVANGYAGPGSRKLNDSIFPKLATKYHLDGKRTSFDFGAQYSYVLIPSTEDFDLETGLIIQQDASARHAVNANFGVLHKVDKLNSISYSASASKNIYTGIGVDNSSFNNSLGWSHVLTNRFNTNFGVGARLLTTDDVAKTETMIYSGNAGLSGRLTKRLSGNLGVGINVISTAKGDLLLPGAPRSTKTNIGYSANGGFQYSLKTFSFGANMNYGLQPTSLGGIQNNFGLGLKASKEINERSSIAAVASAQFISSTNKNDGSSNTSRYSFGPTYSYQLTRDWNMSAGYKFTLRDNNLAKAKAHSAFLSLAWKFGTK